MQNKRPLVFVGFVAAVAVLVFLLLGRRSHREGTARAEAALDVEPVVEEVAVSARVPEPASEPAPTINALRAAPSAIAPSEPAPTAGGCPIDLPQTTSPCDPGSNASLRCSYGSPGAETICSCDSATDKASQRWQCHSAAAVPTPPDCPGGPPPTGEACSWVNQLCRYGDDPDIVMCRCQTSGWACLPIAEWRHSK